MTFQKPDEGAYAVATLKRVSLSDGAVTSIASVNTGSHIPGPAIQAADRTISCAEACFESSVYAYYVEVVLWKAAADSQPRVLGLRVQLSYRVGGGSHREHETIRPCSARASSCRTPPCSPC